MNLPDWGVSMATIAAAVAAAVDSGAGAVAGMECHVQYAGYIGSVVLCL